MQIRHASGTFNLRTEIARLTKSKTPDFHRKVHRQPRDPSVTSLCLLILFALLRNHIMAGAANGIKGSSSAILPHAWHY